MAIKTSWTAGEVLTAADLTDTFANKAGLTPISSQTITAGTATVKPLILRAASGQTANLLEFQNSAGTAVRAVLPDGTITGQNLLYNGAMQVAQRSTSVASITTGGYYTADRFVTDITTLGTWTQSVENDAPTGSGLRKSLKMLCSTADGSPAAGDILSIAQSLEGQDLQRIRKGTSDATQMTLSFWVKSNVTGTYTVLVFDNDNSRATSFAYSISASATWERKTILIPADTTGALDNDNAASLTVFFCLGAGSNFTSGSLQATWASYTAANRAVGQVNLAAAINNYWQITGVQLEVGPVASPFDFKPYGQELRECERYYKVFDSDGQTDRGMINGVAYLNNQILAALTWSRMRAAPTATVSNSTQVDVVTGGVVTTANNTLAGSNLTPTSAQMAVNNTGTPFTQGHGAVIRFDGASLALAAEL